MSLESSGRKYDPHSSSLDEIIRYKKEEGVVFDTLDANYRKRSKWDRYVDSDSDKDDEDDDDFPFILRKGRHESSESEEEPISIPLHGGLDEDSFYHCEGATLSNAGKEGNFADDRNQDLLNEDDDDSVSHQNLPIAAHRLSANASTANSSLDYAQGYAYCDDEEPVDIHSSHAYGPQMQRMAVKRSGGLKRKLDVGVYNDGEDKTALGDISGRHTLKPIRRTDSRTVSRGNAWKSALSTEDAGMVIEEIVISDDEEAEEVRARDKNKGRSEEFRKDMNILQSRVSEEISKKDCSQLSLNDIILKAKQCFSSPSSFNSSLNNSPGGSQGAHGCPEEIVKKQLPKYWKMRYELFSKYDEGIQLDYESWYSVTPEVIAKRIAKRCKISNGIIIDAFCGCGGNSIQFAKLTKKVIAVDIDPVKIKYAENNAKIYGVSENIQFIVGDFMKLAPALKADGIFLSPPWGGPSYLQANVFDLRTMIPMDGFKVFQLAKNISRNVAYFVPRTTSHEQLVELGEGSPVDIEDNILNGRKITYTAYYGDFTTVKGRAAEPKL